MSSQNTSIYPLAIDGFQQVPLFVDGMSLITADGINRYRSAIINLESTLGIAPHISEKYDGFSTVSERLDFLDGVISDFDKKIDEISLPSLQGVTDIGNITVDSIVVGGLTSNGDLVVNGNISFDTIDASLNDLIDVNTGFVKSGDVLLWNGEVWTAGYPQVSLSSDDLTDVNIENPEIGDTLIWNGNGWDSGQVSLSSDDLTDVNTGNPEVGDTLIWDGFTWNSGQVSLSSNDLTDVESDSPSLNDTLVWDGDSWNTRKAVLSSNDLTDVDSDNPNLNDTLVWDGDSWNTKRAVLSSNDLTDVDSDSPKLNDALIWNGNSWNPGKVSRAALSREEVEDIAGQMFLDAGHVAISAEYNDDLGKIKLKNGIKYLESLFNVSSDLPNLSDVLSWDGAEWRPTKIDIPDEESIEDIVGLMISGGIHSSISATYDDDMGTISISNEANELESLLDTEIINPSEGQILSYDSNDNLWKNVDNEFDNLVNIRTISTDGAEGLHFVADASVDDHVILCEFTDDGVVDFFLHLPNPCPSGKEIIIKDKNSINELGEGQLIRVVPTNGMLIDGLFEFALDTKNQSITIVCDGSNYWII